MFTSVVVIWTSRSCARYSGSAASISWIAAADARAAASSAHAVPNRIPKALSMYAHSTPACGRPIISRQTVARSTRRASSAMHATTGISMLSVNAAHSSSPMFRLFFFGRPCCCNSADPESDRKMNALAGAVELSVAVWRTAAVVAWLAGALVRPAPPLPADGWLRRADGARAAVVLLHGVNQNGWVWRQKARHLAAALPADADVFAPLLDHGEPTSANAGRVADAVRAWRAAHPGARVVVAGFSNGGRLALWLARDAHVDNVVLVAAPIGGARWVELLPPWLLRWKISAKLEEELRTHHWTARAASVNPRLAVTAFAADWDGVVWPPARAAYPGTVLRVLGGHTHFSIPYAAEVADAVRRAIQ